MKRMLIALSALLLFAGCRGEDNRHVFYVDPDGATTWTVFQDELRSSEEDPVAREIEERELLDRVRRSRHAVAEALGELGPLWVDSKIVRAQAPFAVVTEARFESVARAVEGFLNGIGFEAEAELDRRGAALCLTFRFREPEGSDGSDESALDPLIAGMESYRFVLTRGKFVAANGFRLEAGDTAAVMLEAEDEDEGTADRFAEYSLTWIVD